MGDTQASKPFETDRTQRWKQTELQPEGGRPVQHIEEFGCSVGVDRVLTCFQR